VNTASERTRDRRLARVLLADTGLATRLTLKSILSTAGYSVSGVATAAEARGKLDTGEYQLVLADLRAESEEAGPQVLAYARQKEFRPATALLASELASDLSATGSQALEGGARRSVHISQENISSFLSGVAELIGRRADRRMMSQMMRMMSAFAKATVN
jgi:CheY-like chemotaxis protein